MSDFDDPLEDAIRGGVIIAILIAITVQPAHTFRDLLANLVVGAMAGITSGYIGYFFLRWYYARHGDGDDV